MKYLIAGLGSIGRRHLRNLVSLGENDILLYRTHHSTLPASDFSEIPVTTDLDEALACCPDAVIISNPTSKHLDVAIPAAEAGCHLLLEKPISHNLNKIDQLKKIMETKGKKTLIGFHFRFHPVLIRIKSILDSGELGRPLSVHAHWGEYLPNWHPWEDYRKSYAAQASLGGGVALTLSHPFDYLRWLIGDVTSLSAITAKTSDLDLDVEDHVEAILHFDNGCLGSVHLDYFQQPASHWFEIIFSQGIIHWDYITGCATVTNGIDGTIQKITLPDNFERNDLYLEEMRHFVDLVKGNETNSYCSLEDGIEALKITLGVYQSAASQNMQVIFDNQK